MLLKQYLLAFVLGYAQLAQCAARYGTDNYTTHPYTVSPSPTGSYPGRNCSGEGCGGVCGDKKIQAPYEQCDLGPELNGAAGSGCSADCKIVPCCGNGILEAGEDCESSSEIS